MRCLALPPSWISLHPGILSPPHPGLLALEVSSSFSSSSSLWAPCQGFGPSLSASVSSLLLSTWGSRHPVPVPPPHAPVHALFLSSLFPAPILVAMETLQRVPGGGWGQGARAAAACTISDARHPRGTVAGAHVGGAWPFQASKASPGLMQAGEQEGQTWE